MLRAERASRRINHSNASYTTNGSLLCNLCSVPVKSESAWSGHLKSTQHTLRVQRAQEAAAARPAEPASKKRKASTLDEPGELDTKRAKAETAEHQLDGKKEEVAAPTKTAEADAAQQESAPHVDTAQLADGVDEDEWAAFERDLATTQHPSAVYADATISAAPVTAEEIAAQAREEQSTQKGRRDAEIEAEKEEAEQMLENEFEEMEGFEERVRRLREKREALRKTMELEGGDPSAPAANVAMGNGHVAELAEEEDDEDDDEDDGWNFGST